VKRAPAPRGCVYPEDFAPEERSQELAVSYGLNVHKLHAAFKDHHRARGTVFKDWQAAFRNWIRNEVKFTQRGVHAV
jgi:aromatic ring-opening dioxygenase catalytic subunit (LigB family)